MSEREKHTEAVIPLSPVKPFHVKPHTEMALQLHPMPKPQRVRKKGTQRQKKQKETDILSITGVRQTRNYQKKSVWGSQEPHTTEQISLAGQRDLLNFLL